MILNNTHRREAEASAEVAVQRTDASLVRSEIPAGAHEDARLGERREELDLHQLLLPRAEAGHVLEMNLQPQEHAGGGRHEAEELLVAGKLLCHFEALRLCGRRVHHAAGPGARRAHRGTQVELLREGVDEEVAAHPVLDGETW